MLALLDLDEYAVFLFKLARWFTKIEDVASRGRRLRQQIIICNNVRLKYILPLFSLSMSSFYPTTLYVSRKLKVYFLTCRYDLDAPST